MSCGGTEKLVWSNFTRKKIMKAKLQKICVRVSFSLACCLAAAIPASAGMTPGIWLDGNWTCKIDGRPARMAWKVIDDTQQTCSGGTCSLSHGVRRVGSFSDNGSKWVPLTDPRQESRGGFFFRHADGNQWYLPKPSGNRTSGWTTWNGARYPLSCSK
jgi:hypothetical protein